MRFNRRARLDTSNVRDRRAGTGVAAAGGGVVLIVLLVSLLTGRDLTGFLPSGGAQPDATSGLAEQCRSGADIQQHPECRYVAVENSVQDFWTAEFARRSSDYAPATLNPFTGSVQTGCGTASAQVGPFYCPVDQGVYLDLAFLQRLLDELGAEGGDFAEAYIVAHEYGHHVQYLLGFMEGVQTQEGEDSDGVRLELQADCLSGVWAHHATQTPSDGGAPVISAISQDDIREGLDAAASVGDDYIQERFEGHVTPETWTHGSSEQRQRWFTTGLDTGDLDACDTFSAADL
jgi:uncharacterized protein